MRKLSILEVLESAISKENNDLVSNYRWLPGGGGASHREALRVESAAIRLPGQQPWRVIPWLTVRVASHVMRRPCEYRLSPARPAWGNVHANCAGMFAGVCAHSFNKCGQVKAER